MGLTGNMESLDFAHGLALCLLPKEGGEGRLKTAPASGQFPAKPPPYAK